jgi:high-affinity nickel permease
MMVAVVAGLHALVSDADRWSRRAYAQGDGRVHDQDQRHGATLGLRHAFDADHISAIDNTTRKLIREGAAAQRPSGSRSATRRSCSRSRS